MTTDASAPRCRRWILAALACYWVAMFAGTHVPLPPPVDDLPDGSDKVFHFCGYAGLAFLLGALHVAAGSWRRRTPAFVLAVIAAYSVADELLQIPVGRTADLYDLLADWAGATLGLAALCVCRRVLARAA